MNALGALEQLVDMSTDEELKAFDEYLKDRPEFTFYNGANKELESRPNLLAANKIERTKFDMKFKKEGLAWIMALGRIELGSTLSLHGKTKRPFEEISNSDYDSEEFVNILIDDVVGHMKSLAQEDGFKTVTRRSHRADSWTLAYLRRIKLIKDMLRTIAEVGGAEVSVEVDPYRRELNRYQEELVSQIQSEIASVNPTGAGSGSGPGGSGTRTGPPVSSPLLSCESFVNQNFNFTFRQ